MERHRMQICELCGLLAEDVTERKMRVSMPVEGIIDPEYEYDRICICRPCGTRLAFALAEAEMCEIAAIRDEAAARRKRQGDRVAFLMAQEAAEEAKATAQETEETEEAEA